MKNKIIPVSYIVKYTYIILLFMVLEKFTISFGNFFLINYNQILKNIGTCIFWSRSS